MSRQFMGRWDRPHRDYAQPIDLHGIAEAVREARERRQFWAVLWGCVMIAAILAVLLIAPVSMCGCSIPATVPAFPERPTEAAKEPGAASRPTEPVSEVRASPSFLAWLAAKNRELSTRFGYPEPDTILIHEAASPSEEDCRLTRRGEYSRDDRQIRVWLLDQDSEPYTDEQLEFVVIHERLHWLDHMEGRPPDDSPDHVNRFRKRAKDLGL